MNVCKNCKAVGDKKKWAFNEKVYNQYKDNKEVKKILCPACERIKNKITCGILYLEGEILLKKKDEILHFINNEAEKALSNNFMSRILRLDEEGSKITIYSIDAPLVLYLGKRFKEVFHGHLQVQKKGEHITGRKGEKPRGEDVIVKWTEQKKEE